MSNQSLVMSHESLVKSPYEMIPALLASLGIEEADFKAGKSRMQFVSDARCIIAHILTEYWPSMTYGEIGYLLGRKTHSTVCHLLKRYQELVQQDALFQLKVRITDKAFDTWLTSFQSN